MKSKYGAKKITIDNIKFHSRAEANYYSHLKLLKRAKQIVGFEIQPEYIVYDGFVRDGKKYQPIKYRGDFLVTYPDGRKEVIDVKGVQTPVYRLKKMMFESKYPHLTIKEIRR